MHEHHETSSNRLEYLKFAFIILFISIISLLFSNTTNLQLVEAFMGVFFVVFGSFKLINLKEFAYGFQSYDIVAKKSLMYSYTYPFIQLVIGFLYLTGFSSILLNISVLIISLVSSIGVIKSLSSKTKIHCVCLGNVVKLPLSTISFVEDFGMALMAVAMIFLM